MDNNAIGRSIRALGKFFAVLVLSALGAAQVFAQSADVKECGEKKGDEAIDACTRAINAGPRNKALAGIYFNRAIEWNAKKDFDRAIADYTEAIKINADYREAFNNRGNAHRNKKDYDRAIEDYEQAIRIAPKRGLYHRNRGNVLMDKRDYEKALASFNEAIKLDANDADASDSAAWLMATAPDAKLRNGKRAVELAQKACELTQWKNGSYVDTLAAAFAEAGDFAEAVRREQQALANPEFEQSEGKNARARLAMYKAGKPNRLRAAGAK
ncbi:MAG: tetratricopeptide repeat protein [Burkholderiales bacterium]